jgi:hypothetical protein
MKKILLALIFFIIIAFVSCDSTSDPKVDDDSLNDGVSLADEDDVQNDDDDKDEPDDVVTDDKDEVHPDDEIQPECKADEMKCDGTVLMWCKDGEWTTVKDCANEEKVCETVEDVAQCVEEEIKCTQGEFKCSGTAIMECSADGEWIEDEDCDDNNQICKDDGDIVKCEDVVVAVCDPDETKCSGDVVLKCNASGQWANHTVCSDEDKECVMEDDDAVCKFPPCTLDDKKCSGTEIHKCNSSEIWEVETDCDLESKICKDNGTTVECIVPPVCTPGHTECNGNTVNFCNVDGQWEPMVNCVNSGKVCIAEGTSASCKVAPCTLGDKKCDGKAVLTCNESGTWDSEDCAGVQLCDDDGTTVECKNPPECSEGEKKCFGDTLMTCSEIEEWSNPVNCNNTDEFCDSSGSEPMCKCTFEEQKCDGTKVMACDVNGVWQAQVDCDDTSKICSYDGVTAQCKIPAVCSPGEKQCNGNLIEVCNPDGQWELMTTCSGNTPSCMEIGDNPTCVCQNDDLRCQGAILQKCSDGVWGQEEDCSETSKECRVEDDTAQCAVPLCTTDDKNCSGDTLLKCNSEGVWKTSEVCSDRGELCRNKNSEYQCVCTPDKLKCGERDTGHEDYIIYKCDSNYDWIEETDCLEDNPEKSQACHQTSTTTTCIDIECGDGTWHDMVEWCDPSDPLWASINSGSQNLACQDYWLPASGVGGSGNLTCRSSCMFNLINCEPVGTPYGTITSIEGTIPYVFDWEKRADTDYIEDHREGIVMPDPFFTGTVDSLAIPSDPETGGWESGARNMAFRASSGAILHFQDTFEYDGPGEEDFNWLDQSILVMFRDTVQTGTYAVDFFSGIDFGVYDVHNDEACLKAIGFLGKINFSSVNNLTNVDGGSYTMSGETIYLHHPSDIPIYGDITDQVEGIWGVPACPE